MQLYDEAGVWPPTQPEITSAPRAPRRQSTRPTNGFPGHDPFANPFYNRPPFGANSFNDPLFSGPRAFNDPFFNRGFGFGQSAFTFTDPFELFNSIFGDIHALHAQMLSEFSDPFFTSVHNDAMRGFPMMAPPPLFSDPFFRNVSQVGPSFASHRSMTGTAMNNGLGWVSQSTMSRTINGRTETITTKRDAQVVSSIPIVSFSC